MCCNEIKSIIFFLILMSESIRIVRIFLTSKPKFGGFYLVHKLWRLPDRCKAAARYNKAEITLVALEHWNWKAQCDE